MRLRAVSCTGHLVRPRKGAERFACPPQTPTSCITVTRVFGRNKLHADWIFSARKEFRCPTHLDFIPAQLQYPTRCRTPIPQSCHASHRSQALLPSCAAPSFKRGLKRGVVRTRGRFKVLWRLFDLSSLSECVRHEKGGSSRADTEFNLPRSNQPLHTSYADFTNQTKPRSAELV
jgi:hypothetical protein